MAARTVYVDTVNGSASPTDPTQSNDAYDDLQQACTSEASNSGNDLTIICSGATDDSTGVNALDNITADSVTIEGDATTGLWDANAYTFTGAFGIQMGGDVPCTIKNIQVKLTFTTGTQNCIATVTSSSVSTTFNFDSIFISFGDLTGATAARGFYSNNANQIWNIYNCIVEGGSTATTSWAMQGNAGTMNVYNCTVSDMVTGIRDTDVVTNCAVFDCTDDFSNPGTVTYSASDDVQAGTGNIQSITWADEFEDHANGDYRFKAGADQLVSAGTDDPSSGLYSDDIKGSPRASTWDIGAFGRTYITSVSSDDTIGATENPWTIAGSGFGTQ